jgi:PST family polysaccharide transporter
MTEERGHDLRHVTVLGARWLGGSRLVTEVTAFGSVVVLARLIPPSEFGRAAVPLVIVGVAVILGPLGLTAVIVQRPRLSKDEIQGATFLCLALGISLTALTLLFAAIGGGAVFGEATADLIALASPAWLLAGLGGVPQALVQRELRFGRTAVIEAAPAAGGSLTAVCLALLGGDGAALVAGGLALLGSAAILALASVPLVRPKPSAAGVRSLLGFATPVTVSSLVYLGFRHVDYLILAARMAPAQVGFYWRAYQLGVEYQGKISQVMLRVSLPVFSRAEDPDELRRLRLRIVRTHATVIVPLLAGFIAVAPTLIPWVFGRAWEPAVVPAQIMAVAGMCEAVTTGVGPLAVAVGKPGLLLWWNLVELAAYAVTIALVAPYGLTWVAVAVAAYSCVSALVIQVVLMPRVVGLGLRDFWRDIRAGVVTGAVALVVLVPVRDRLEKVDTPVIVLLAVMTAVGIAVFATVLRLAFHDIWNDLLVLGRRVLGRDAPVPDESSPGAARRAE